LDLAVTNPSDNTVSIFLQTASSAGAAASMVSAENPAGMNQPVTFTTVVYGNPMPTGSVTFKQGQNVLGAAPLVNGQASVTATFAKAGTFAITARYSGDQNYAAQKSNVVKQVVSEYSSSIEVESGSSFSYYGQVVPVTAYVDSAAPSPPTGTVTFYDGTQSLGKVAVANGSATILLRSSLPAGTYSITATYNGDAMSGKSATATALTQTIYPATTATALTSSGNPSVVGHNVTFTATVTSPTSLPKGTVTFTAGGVTLGTVNVNGDKASLTTCRLPAGTITVTATYNGTANIGGSSQSMVQTVH
jgi:hypothetical protein